MKIGILGAGGIAATMARTIRDMKNPQIECYAVGSRSAEKAAAFAGKFRIPRAYGSYEDMLADKNIDLVYVATPHSEHYRNVKLCLEHGKNVLCEKAFTTDAQQARELFALAEKKQLLLTEAIWTRYMPSRRIIRELTDSGIIGTPHSIQANLGYPIGHVERMVNPDLAGGALLDLGVYPINFAMMVFGDDTEPAQAHALMSDRGIDLIDNITLTWTNRRFAALHANMLCPTDRRGLICGEEGYITVTNINNPEAVRAYDSKHNLIKECGIPAQVSGYEYEVEACFTALSEGRTECSEMPHTVSVKVMEILDSIRRQWNMKYPWET